MGREGEEGGIRVHVCGLTVGWSLEKLLQKNPVLLFHCLQPPDLHTNTLNINHSSESSLAKIIKNILSSIFHLFIFLFAAQK